MYSEILHSTHLPVDTSAAEIKKPSYSSRMKKTPEQVAILREAFKRDKYTTSSRDEVLRLAEETGLSETTIRVQ